MQPKVSPVLHRALIAKRETLLLMINDIAAVMIGSDSILRDDVSGVLDVLYALTEQWKAIVLLATESNPGYEFKDLPNEQIRGYAELQHRLKVIRAVAVGRDSLGD